MPTLTQINALDSVSALQTPTCQAPPRDLLISRMSDGLVLPGSPFEDIIKDIFKKLALSEEDAIRLRTLALESEQSWRKELLQKLGEEGMTGATRARQHRMVSGFAHAIEPLPMIVAGVVVIAAATGPGAAVAAPVIALAIAAVTIGSLMALDSAFGDPAKRALASTLARGDTEDTQQWMNRIYMITGIVSLACSIGLGMGTPELAAQGIQKVATIAASQAANVSEVAAQGAKVFTDRRTNTQQAVLLELEAALRSSDSKLKDDLATLKHLEASVKSLFDTLESSLKFQADCSSRIFNH